MRDELLNSSDYRSAKNYAIKRLAMKSSHSLDLAKALQKREIPQEIISHIVAECVRLGFLNDTSWTASFVRVLRLRKYGYRAIQMKLHAKGITQNEALVAIETIKHEEGEDGNDERSSIARLLTTRYQKRDLSIRKERDKVIAALARKGYQLDDIFAVLSARR